VSPTERRTVHTPARHGGRSPSVGCSKPLRCTHRPIRACCAQ
jgi:hypothetical protein